MVFLIRILCPLGHRIAEAPGQAPNARTDDEKLLAVRAMCTAIRDTLEAKMTAGSIPTGCPVCGIRSDFWEFVSSEAEPGVTLQQLYDYVKSAGKEAQMIPFGQQPSHQVH